MKFAEFVKDVAGGFVLPQVTEVEYEGEVGRSATIGALPLVIRIENDDVVFERQVPRDKAEVLGEGPGSDYYRTVQIARRPLPELVVVMPTPTWDVIDDPYGEWWLGPPTIRMFKSEGEQAWEQYAARVQEAMRQGTSGMVAMPTPEWVAIYDPYFEWGNIGISPSVEMTAAEAAEAWGEYRVKAQYSLEGWVPPWTSSLLEHTVAGQVGL